MDNLINYDNCENLMIVAHPDDETFWGGYELLKGNYFVVCITNGYNQKRKNDFYKILELSNNKGVILNFKDTLSIKKFKNQENEIKIFLKNLIYSKKWKKIITHNKKGEYGHPHHKLVSKWVTEIYNKTEYFNYHNRFYYWFKKKPSKSLTNQKQNLINIYKKSQLIASYWFKYSLYIL